MVGVAAAAALAPLISVPGAAAAAGARLGTVRVPSVHVAGLRNTNQSNNWSGYNIGNEYPGIPTGTVFTQVSGGWVVPTAKQHTSGQAEYSASWVGIGGGCVTDNCSITDSTLIQAGTSQDIASNGKASYYSWYELIPKTSVETSLAVSPGNKVDVSIQETAPATWKIDIDNVTTGKSWTKTVTYTSSMDTAEWIEETPLVLGARPDLGIAHLPTLGTVHFGAATLNGQNADLQTLDEMQLVSGGQVLATPSGPNPKANGFNDCTYATSCAAP